MYAKHGFDWKKIENKPESWETIRELIQDGSKPRQNEREVKDKNWNNDNILLQWVEIFPDMKEWVTLSTTAFGKTTTSTKKKDIIIERQTIELIKTDLKKIRFDMTSQTVISTPYSMEISFLIMIITWNYTFILRKKANVPIKPVAFLDAIISLNRIYKDEYSHCTEAMKAVLDKALTRMNGFVDEEMYDLLFSNPYLLVQSFADKRIKKVKLYPEQHQVLDVITDSIKKNNPILLGNQMPTGTGKTMLSVPLAQKINSMRLKKTVLFACSNELVNEDVASTALLADDLHLWLARLIRDDTIKDDNKELVLLRPYKRCFPATWKKVYKKDDKEKNGTIQQQWEYYIKETKRQPDMIIADLEATTEILKVANDLNNPFVAYIDEFISDDRSNQLMKNIGKNLPRQSVIISAILPPFPQLPLLIGNFCDRHQCDPANVVRRVDTAVVNISCAIIDPEGYLAMPHHDVRSKEDLNLLLENIRINPRIRRSYTAKHVYHWCKTVDQYLAPAELSFYQVFPNIGTIRNASILDHVISMLEFLSEHYQLLEAFQAYRPRIMDPPSTSLMFTDQSHCYDGKTLFITQKVYEKVMDTTFPQSLQDPVKKLFDDKIQWSDLVKTSRDLQSGKEKAFEDCKKMVKGKKNNDRLDAKDIALEKSSILEQDTSISLPMEYVVNSKYHAQRWGNHSLLSQPRTYLSLRMEYDEAFEPEMNLLLSAGIGIYDIQSLTEYQRRLVMECYPQLMFLCSGKEIVFGTNLPSLTNIFIDKSFGDVEHADILYQLMGRAGRMGKSYHANIYVNSTTTLEKILNFRHNDVDPMIALFDASFI